MKKLFFALMTLTATIGLNAPYGFESPQASSHNQFHHFPKLESGAIICLDPEVMDYITHSDQATDNEQEHLIDQDLETLKQWITRPSENDETTNLLTQQDDRGYTFINLKNAGGDDNAPSSLRNNRYVKEVLSYSNHEEKTKIAAEYLKKNFNQARKRGLIVGCVASSLFWISSASIAGICIFLSHYDN